ncbi:hypothetical protein JXO59_09395 [candidate division KSB1 bacterium]|nr:hypothetical protein [candidate division KSB1 bacterium]
MKMTGFCSVMFILFYLVTSLAQESIATVDEFHWLTGCWRAELQGTILEEHWSKPAGGTLVGFSRALDQGQTVFIEFSTIHTVGDDIFYTATIVASGTSTPFKLVEWDSATVTFARPEHDFPQQIIYQRSEKDKLFIQLHGEENGEHKVEAYTMQRMDCR